LSQDKETGITKITPVRIEVTFYYPTPLPLSEDVLVWHDSNFDNMDEPSIQIDPISSAASARQVEPPLAQVPLARPPPPPSTLDPGLRPVATSSLVSVSVASSARSRQTGSKRQAAKKPRAVATAGSGSGGGGAEEQVFNYVVQRFDDDVRLDYTPPPPPSAVDSPLKDDRKTPTAKAGKKKGQQEAQAAEKPMDDVGGLKTPMTDAQLRRIAAERLWNVQRSPNARCTVDRFTRYTIR